MLVIQECLAKPMGNPGANTHVCVRVCVHKFTAVRRHVNKGRPPAVVKAAELDNEEAPFQRALGTPLGGSALSEQMVGGPPASTAHSSWWSRQTDS